MTLAALQHLIHAAHAMADDREFIVLGSASLLASHPELGLQNAPLASTYDADLCPIPFDELTGTMLEEALGGDRAYFRRHGYHADILRDCILQTLPHGWQTRLVPIPNCPAAKAIDPHDLAAIKLLVGRPKDLALVKKLVQQNLIQPDILRPRLDHLDIPVELLPRLLSNFSALTPAPDP